MTLTINYNGKTYKNKEQNFTVDWKQMINTLVSIGALEEVEENTELDVDFIKSEYKRFKDAEKKWIAEDEKQRELFFTKDSSILEKLRVYLEKEMNEAHTKVVHSKTVEILEYFKGRERALEDVLTSLETKEEPQILVDEDKEVKELKKKLGMAQPQFTPGQEIEVSNDGEKWEKREFHKYTSQDGYFVYFYGEDYKFYERWKFARHIDKIEPELPEVPDFIGLKVQMESNYDEKIVLSHVLVQIQILTKAYQTLARQKTTK